ncbi:MAG: hypothetical protein ACLR76_03405 [Alistipes sp.]
MDVYQSFPYTDWQRIERVVRECRISVLSLALSLGFKRPDPLYRIKSSERKITLALAVRIHRNWPQFNLGWLLTGQGPVRLKAGSASEEKVFPRFPTALSVPEESSPRRRPSRLSVGGN